MTGSALRCPGRVQDRCPMGKARALLLVCGAHFGSMCGPHFCSMKITQDVRDYAATHGIAEKTAALVQGLREKVEGGRGGGRSTDRPEIASHPERETPR